MQQTDYLKSNAGRQMKVISIIPRLPPAIDGVGDYALNLARQLRKNFEIDTQFIVCDPTWQGSTCIEGFSIDKIETRSAGSLFAKLKQHTSSVVFLHFSGYGYAKRSCCFWLIESLEQWKQSTSNTLVTMFHEVYSAFGVPWKSQFWASHIQRSLAARLIKISDRCLTNIELHAKMLSSLCHIQPQSFYTLPVFSNIGEPDQNPPLSERKKHLVIFGQTGSRIKAYRESGKLIEKICKGLEIEQILDIGKPTGMKSHTIGDVPLVELGECSPADISRTLQNSIAGFLNYDPFRLAKSGIFAAYCAHGLIPINANSADTIHDGINSGKQYWTLDNTDSHPELASLQTIADNADRWYKTHSLNAQARIFNQILTTLYDQEAMIA
jgi:hypothetical protein